MKGKDKIIEKYKRFVYGNKEQNCIKLLKKYPFLLETTFFCEKNTPFLLACQRNHRLVIDYLIKKGVNVHLLNYFQQNAVSYAVLTEDVELLKKIYALGIDLDQKDVYGYTPFLEACIYDYSDIIKFLIEKDVDVNAQNETTSFVSLLLNDAFELDFNFICKHLDKFNEKNQKILKGLQLKNLVTKGSI